MSLFTPDQIEQLRPLIADIIQQELDKREIVASVVTGDKLRQAPTPEQVKALLHAIPDGGGVPEWVGAVITHQFQHAPVVPPLSYMQPMIGDLLHYCLGLANFAFVLGVLAERCQYDTATRAPDHHGDQGAA